MKYVEPCERWKDGDERGPVHEPCDGDGAVCVTLEPPSFTLRPRSWCAYGPSHMSVDGRVLSDNTAKLLRK